MNILQRRRYRKLVAHLVHEARHVENMRGDLLAPEQLEALRNQAAKLQAAWKARDTKAVDIEAERLESLIRKLYPPPRHPKIREYVEMISVALAVAMGIRTYFVQPFKIPTGSMQPTLYGITVTPQDRPRWYDRFPLNIIGLALFGERYAEVRARVSGVVEGRAPFGEEGEVFFIRGVGHPVRRGMALYVSLGERVSKGQLIASGRIRIGDHIFVNKIAYNVRRPRRGEIVVFGTDGIQDPHIRPHSFYIKRLAGLPGESIRIDPPYLLVDGQRVTSPYPFERLVKDREHGYSGYALARAPSSKSVYLGSLDTERTLSETEYLMLGDNTHHSYDSRYFGPVPQENLVGPAFMVYWPLSRRWGPVR